MKWLLFPLSSTLLLIVSFYPFHIWPLGFVALVPLIYFTEKNPVAYTRIFLSGFTTGFLFPLALMSDTVMNFTWLPEAHFFQTIIRWTSLPIALAIGLLFGGAILLYATKLRTASSAKNIFILALLWALVEWLITFGTGGYNLGILAHTTVSIPFLVSLAALGGIHTVSMIVILCNVFVAFLILILRGEVAFPRQRYLVLTAGTIGVIIALFLANTVYLRQGQTEQTVAVAVLQNNDRQQNAFGTFEGHEFSFGKLASLIREARDSDPVPTIIIYPFSVSKEILTTSTSSSPFVATAPLDEFSAWAATTLGSTTLVTWNTVEKSDGFSNEIGYWHHGSIVSAYQKTNLFPFMDYTPQWAQRIGLYSTVVDEIPGDSQQQTFEFSDARIASAVCSEINSAETIRNNARHANILFSIGSDAMFSDSFAAEFDLASAQFRAAENNAAIVRANRFGPSGFITSDGRIIQKTSYEADGVFVTNVPYEEQPRKTLYSLTGDALFVFGGIISLLLLVL